MRRNRCRARAARRDGRKPPAVRNHVEESCAQVLVAIGLVHSECVLHAALGEFHEAHGARALRHDAGQVNGAAARHASARKGACRVLGASRHTRRCVSGSEPSGMRDGARDCLSGAYTARRGIARVACAFRFGGLTSYGREERKSATQMCRCEPLLSNRSNKVGQAPTCKAFRPRADMHNAVRKRWSRAFKLRSEVTRLTVEHRRRRSVTVHGDAESATSENAVRATSFTLSKI